MCDTKKCKDCGVEKPASEFSAYQRRGKTYRRFVCKPCDSARATAWGRKNPGRKSAYCKKYHEDNRDRLLQHKRAMYQENRQSALGTNKEWRDNNPVKLARCRDADRAKKHGMTVEEMRNFLEQRSGVCEICGSHESACVAKHAIDHCHDTGRVRGLLCSKCNLALGGFGDSLETILKAAEYLEKYSTPSVQDD